jgi:hypothetical protein
MIHTNCAFTRVRRAARSLTDLYDESLRPLGVKITQFSLLRTLARMGPVNISTLAWKWPSIGRPLAQPRRPGAPAARQPLRRRRFAGADRRADREAHRLLAKAEPRWEQAQARVSHVLGKDGVTTLFTLLERFEALR